MIRDRADLKALEHDQNYFSYFEKRLEGQTHLHSTIGCSRGAAGLFGAYAALHYLGIGGFQRLVANALQNANYCRFRLSGVPGVKRIAVQNQGPGVGRMAVIRPAGARESSRGWSGVQRSATPGTRSLFMHVRPGGAEEGT